MARNLKCQCGGEEFYALSAVANNWMGWRYKGATLLETILFRIVGPDIIRCSRCGIVYDWSGVGKGVDGGGWIPRVEK